MSRPASPRSARFLALGTLALLAVITGFAFAGTGLEMEPPSEARDGAARAAAVRVALDLPLFDPLPVVEAAEGAAPVERQPLLAGEEQITLARNATRIRIASLGIDAEIRTVGYVFENGALQYDVPRFGAGQYVGTAAPGEKGNSVIAGHVASRSGPAVFENLSKVRPGEIVEVFRGDQVFRYLVTEIRVVAPEATAVMAQTQDATLTLITCSLDQNYSKRFVVVGKLL